MGQGYLLKCNKCDYSIEYHQGVGFLYPIEASNMLTDMQQGKFGKRFMKKANEAKSPSVEFSRELYICDLCDICDLCGELRPAMQIDLLDEGKVVLSKKHICGKCRGQMRVTKSKSRLECPKCKSKLEIRKRILWD